MKVHGLKAVRRASKRSGTVLITQEKFGCCLDFFPPIHRLSMPRITLTQAASFSSTSVRDSRFASCSSLQVEKISSASVHLGHFLMDVSAKHDYKEM